MHTKQTKSINENNHSVNRRKKFTFQTTTIINVNTKMILRKFKLPRGTNAHI